VVSRHRFVISAAGAASLALAGILSAHAVEQTTANVASPAVVAQADDAAVVWNWLKDSKDPAQIERFIKRFPTSPYAMEARIRLERLRKTASPASVSVVRAPKSPAFIRSPVSEESSRTSRTNILLASRECWGIWCGRLFPILLGVGF
jgi:hypothetical protein